MTRVPQAEWIDLVPRSPTTTLPSAEARSAISAESVDLLRRSTTRLEGDVALTGRSERSDGTVRIVVELRRGWYFFALGQLADGPDRGEYEVLTAHYFMQDRSTLCEEVTPSTASARTLLTRWNAAEHCGVVRLCETCRKSIARARWNDLPVFRVDVGSVEPVVIGPSKPSRRRKPRKRRAR